MELDPISENIGTGLENIRVFKNFIEEEDRKKILEYCESYNGAKTGNIFYTIPQSEELIDLHIKYTVKMFDNLSEYYDDKSKVRYPDFFDESGKFKNEYRTYLSGILAHPIGSFMYPHVDIVGYIQKEDENVPDHLSKWSGHLSSVIYLNDNYEGGELYFKDHDISIKPEAGDYITFPGNRHYQHGVKEVSGAVRYTLSTWVRFEEAYGKEMFSYGIEK
jgi:hypothetical protein